MKDIVKVAVFLTVCCAIAAALLSATYIATASKIEEQKNVQINKSLSKECLPGSASLKITSDHYIGCDINNNVMGYAFRVSPKGYGGNIDMIVGVDIRGRVSGITILSMKETPGLGSKANTPAFLGKFIGKTLSSPLKAKKDVDAITGATITTQAVADGVRQALEKFKVLKLNL
jgi:Na+-translocating ferredoxin:NAD+ oxidoreductase subunit G